MGLDQLQGGDFGSFLNWTQSARIEGCTDDNERRTHDHPSPGVDLLGRYDLELRASDVPHPPASRHWRRGALPTRGTLDQLPRLNAVTADYFPLFATYLFGDIMAIFYVGVFYRYTKQRAYALKAIGVSFAVVLITAIYTILGMTGATGQSTDSVGLVTGYIMAIGSVLLYISPFETIQTVLKTKSGASIPFWMCLAGTTSNVLWMINGLLTSDIFIFLLGTVCAALGMVQVVLYLIYRPGRVQMDVAGSGKESVLPVTAATTPQSDGNQCSLPSPIYIAVHSPSSSK